VLSIILLTITAAVCIAFGGILAFAFWNIFYPENGKWFTKALANVATGVMFLLFLVFVFAPFFDY
jgi:hypothetical protein